MIRITVPHNAKPGMNLSVPLPDGRVVGITVPPGMFETHWSHFLRLFHLNPVK
jgi:hypothetical protein